MLGVKTTSRSSSPTQVNTKRDIPCTNTCYGEILGMGVGGCWWFVCFFCFGAS